MADVLRRLKPADTREEIISRWLSREGTPYVASLPVRSQQSCAGPGAPPKRRAPSLETSTLKLLTPDAGGMIAPGYVHCTGQTNIKVTRYPDGWRATVFESRDPCTKKRERKERPPGDRWLSSVQRSTRQVKHYARCLGADHLWTFTKRGKFASLDELWRVWKEFNRLASKRLGPRWRYVCVPELHKDGTFHMHAIVHGLVDVVTVRFLWQRALTGVGGEVGAASPGNVDVRWIRGVRGPRAAAAYLSKYIGKDLGTTAIEANRRLFASTTGIAALEQHKLHLVHWCTNDEIEEVLPKYLTQALGAEFELHYRVLDGPLRGWVYEQSHAGRKGRKERAAAAN